MIWRVILFSLLAANLAFANLPRFSSVVSVTFCSSQLWGFHYDAVNSARALTYGDFTFASTNNTLANGFNPFTTIAQNAYGVKVTNNLTLYMLSSINLLYDASGNLTNDGTRSFFYDAENQLTNVNVPGTWQAVFVYDGLNRRRIERDYTWQSSAWLLTNETHFVDDGMQIAQERDTNNNPLVTYTRGLDLSMSLDGAGGIGGLLARTGTNSTAFYHSDGIGNVTAMQDTNQNIVARYEYEGFGRTIGMWGAMASANRMRFSSFPVISSGIMLSPTRPYIPELQRWLNRDPIGENGGINLYQAGGNNPVNRIDPYGLSWVLFDSQAWGQLLSDVFIGGGGSGNANPNSNLALRNATGTGITPLTDENGNIVQPGNIVPGALFSAAGNIAMLPMGEEEGAYKAAEAALKAAEAAKAARAAAKCEKAAQKIGNILGKNLKGGPKGDIAGAISDMVGNPIPKPGGGLWDHTQDLGNILRGLQNGVEQLQGATDPAQIAIRQQAEQAIQQIQQAIKGAGL